MNNDPASRCRWLGGALWIQGPAGGLLVDAPSGVETALAREGLLAGLSAVIVSSERSRAVAGLLGLWDALDRVGKRRVSVLHVLGDERTPLLAGAWSQGWPDALRLDRDGLSPGGTSDVCGLVVELVPLRIGDVSWGRRPSARGVAGCGLRIDTDAGRVVWIPTSRPGTAAQRLATGADLAVIEVGVLAWPSMDVAWRLAREDATQVASFASTAWLVGDDGARLPDPDPPN